MTTNTANTTQNTAQDTTQRILKTWVGLGQLIRFQPWFFGANIGLWSLRQLVFLLPGLFMREYFDLLTGDSTLNWTVGQLILLMIGQQFPTWGRFPPIEGRVRRD